MPLQPVVPTESVAANQIAARIVNQILQIASQVDSLRAGGIAARDATAAVVMPSGQVRPAQPAVAAVSPEAINSALGANNNAILDALKSAVGV
jgi:hypothetical protein